MNQLYDKQVTAREAEDFDYPISLLAFILDDVVAAIALKDHSGFDWALANALTDRERKIIIYRWRDRLTLSDVAEKYGVTRERIRQMEGKSLRKLQNKHIREVIRSGIDDEEINRRLRSQIKDENIELRKTLKKIIDNKNLAEQYLNGEHTGDVPEFIREAMPTLVHDESISVLNLSVRSYNCLYRAGYLHLSDFYGVNREKLRRVRNLGKRSFDEVIEALHNIGIEVPE